MLPIGTFTVPELDDQDKYPHDFVTTFATMPSWKDAETGSTYTESHFYSISKTSKHPQEAYDFIRFYTTEGMKIRAISVSGEKGIDKMEFMNMQTVDKVEFLIRVLEGETLEWNHCGGIHFHRSVESLICRGVNPCASKSGFLPYVIKIYGAAVNFTRVATLSTL